MKKIRNISANPKSKHVYDIDEYGIVNYATALQIVRDWVDEPTGETTQRGYSCHAGSFVMVLADEDGVLIDTWEPAGVDSFSITGAPFNFEEVEVFKKPTAKQYETFGRMVAVSLGITENPTLAPIGSYSRWAKQYLGVPVTGAPVVREFWEERLRHLGKENA